MNDGILRLHTPAGVTGDTGHTDYWRKDSVNTCPLHAGHTYSLSVLLRLSHKDAKTTQRVYVGVGSSQFEWYGYGFNVTHVWQRLTATFTATKDAGTASIASYVFTLNGAPETWLEAQDMTLVDTTTGEQCLDIDWYSTDGSAYAINGASVFKE